MAATSGLKATARSGPLIVIDVAADAGSIGGRWASSALIRRGVSVNSARKLAMLLCGCLVAPMLVASHVHHPWMTVVLFSPAAGGHQGWIANVYVLASDLFPRRAVGSVVGFASMAGAAGGIVASLATGRVRVPGHAGGRAADRAADAAGRVRARRRIRGGHVSGRRRAIEAVDRAALVDRHMHRLVDGRGWLVE